MRLAIVHDFLNQFGGAERVLVRLKEIYPDAPIYCSIYLPDNLPKLFNKFNIKTSFIQNLPSLERRFKHYLPLYPFAMKQFNLKGVDCVLTSASSFAKGIRVPAGALHVCYCYTPPRFLWRTQDYLSKENLGFLKKMLIKPLLFLLRIWDKHTSRSVDQFISISENVQSRIQAVYGRSSSIIYPPVDVDYFTPDESAPGNHFLVVSRLIPYKRLDLVIEAFNKLQLPLRIVGCGDYTNMLKKQAGKNIEFIGAVSDEQLLNQLRSCRALIFPGEEDFGIVPVEAQACGRPVIAFAAGGALETVKDPETGVFFHEPNANSLVRAIKRFGSIHFDSARIRKNAERFSTDQFKQRITAFVQDKVQEKTNRMDSSTR